MTDSRYSEAGVDLGEAERAKAEIGRLVASTRTPLALGQIGAFGGMMRLPADIRKPVLVMSTDGVGTKVLVAQQAGSYDTVGEDLVNHSVNDILVHGAEPLAFMDYIAGHRLPLEMIAGVVAGIARGCRSHQMTLAGGETAQMPGLYAERTFDLAGTIVGVVEEAAIIDGSAIVAGDVLIGYHSTGLHTNGYSLARRVLFDELGLALADLLPDSRQSVGDALLAVHRSYAAALRPVLADVHGLAHITGGGIAGNLVRILPDMVDAVVDPSSWEWPHLFAVIADGGRIAQSEMRDVFNLGIGMVAVAPAIAVERLRHAAADAEVATTVIGNVERGSGRVRFTG